MTFIRSYTQVFHLEEKNADISVWLNNAWTLKHNKKKIIILLIEMAISIVHQNTLAS